jgi:hypothetical protein
MSTAANTDEVLDEEVFAVLAVDALAAANRPQPALLLECTGLFLAEEKKVTSNHWTLPFFPEKKQCCSDWYEHRSQYG